jgi:hypothetical protein
LASVEFAAHSQAGFGGSSRDQLDDDAIARHTTERLASFVDATAGKRLTYKDLIG